MISVTNLRKSYGELVAVDGISFEISAGETFGLLGPNGAGKSTTIHMMTGALVPDAGTIDIDHAGSPTSAAARRRIGLSPQSMSLYDRLTGEENLRFFGRIQGLGGAALRERVDWALDFSGLADRRSDLVGRYSGGMQRRLNLACALIHEPRVVVLDEPTAGVDPQSRNHIFDSIERLKASGCTIVYTTHYMEEAQRLCDRIAIMDRGHILAIDTLDGLLDAHGGSALVTAELDAIPDDVDALPGTLDGHTLRIETSDPFAEVARLGGASVRFDALRVERPDLESVFLALTGRSLRD